MSETLTLPYSNDECGLYKMYSSRIECDCPGGLRGDFAKVHHPHFVNSMLRLRSFDLWPAGLQPRPESLAEAGFFYTGESDKTICHYCGGGLKNWAPDDDPWQEHKTHYPNCGFVQQQKGRSVSSANSSEVVHQPTINNVAEALLCKICFAKQMTMTFLPCKHVISCETCSSNLRQCPICRENIEASFKVHLQ